ncbi:helix-turn-helix domain-containing protein [Actinosynnema sp. NPDC059335]|uniref:helix-turn-helix domain-containing protein n=1 Tax=Actinosynnema sp. NPDC059335 TaxID=3346804 RepID=UPI00366D3EE6
MDYPYGDRLFATAVPEAGNGPASAAPKPETAPDGDCVTTPARLLHTPAQAARMLAVPESWLRRMAGRREIACTLVGKHLRFSDADLHSIIQRGSRPARRDDTCGRETLGRHPRHRRP